VLAFCYVTDANPDSLKTSISRPGAPPPGESYGAHGMPTMQEDGVNLPAVIIASNYND
jgi:hypothetical protein